MTQSHRELGFERPMPDVSPHGEAVSVLTSSHEQWRDLEEAREKAAQHLETAGNIRAVLDGADGPVTEIINDFVAATNDHAQNTGTLEAHEEAVIADEVGINGAIDDKTSRFDIASVLGRQPIEDLGKALQETAMVRGGEDVAKVIDAIEASDAQGIEEEHVPIEIELADVKALMETEDEDMRTRHALTLLEDERTGRTKMIPACVLTIFKHVPFHNLESLITTGSSEVEHLIGRIAQIGQGDFQELSPILVDVHAKNLALVEAQMGSVSTEWRKQLRNGQELSPIAREYVERGWVGALRLHRLRKTCSEGLRVDKSPEGITHYQEMFQRGARDAIMYALDLESAEAADAPVRTDMALDFLYGDILQYGFKRKILAGGVQEKLINRDGVQAIQRYVGNIERLGADGAQRLHERFGIVNFGRYDPGLLSSMDRMLDTPPIGQDVSVIVLGKTGDHNAAFTHMMEHQSLERTVVFEVETATDTARVAWSLDRLRGRYDRLTIAGHGGEQGLHVSESFRIGGLDSDLRKMADNPIQNVIERLTPNEKGYREVVLYSCSQGRRYRSAPSTAERISEIHGDRLKVQAPPYVMYGESEGVTGERIFSNDAFYDLKKRILQKYPKAERILEKILARRDGKVVIEGGQRKVSRDGRVRIGA